MPSWSQEGSKFALAIAKTGCFAGVHLAIALALADGTLAQIIPDSTLGRENSTVTSIGAVDRINGGATRGANLFHSFQEFNIANGRSAFFSNAPGIENILSRVTGNNPSNILGTLGVSTGNANLFLINPNGIIFGQNAQLSLNGSFVATTANAIQFGDQGLFIASNTQNVSLLTVKPSAFLFNQLAAQSITNQSVAKRTNSTTIAGLRVREGKSLLLVGGNVNLQGGYLQAPGGRVELGGVAANGAVELNVDGNNLSLSFPDGVARADVNLTQGADVNVSARGGGSISINARNLNMAQLSRLQSGIASNLDATNQAGDIEVNATEKITLTNGSVVDNSVLFNAKGQAGNVLITAEAIAFDGEGSINQNIRGSGVFSRVREGGIGQGGNIDIKTRSLQLSNGAVITTSTRGDGNAGNVTIIADTVSFDGKGQLSPTLGFKQSSAAFSAVTEQGKGQGGNITITARSLTLTNGGAVITSTLGQGDAGNIFINAETVAFNGKGSDSDLTNDFNSSGAYSNVLTDAAGKGGNITVTAGQLSLTNGAVINASTASGAYPAGTLVVNATSSVEVSDTSPDGRIASRLNFDTSGAGDAGELQVNTPRLVISAGARISARTSNQGRAGTLAVNSDFVEVTGRGSGLYFDSSGSGDAQGIRIKTGQLVVQNGGQITVNGTGSGNPGDLEVVANSLFLNTGKLTTETASGNGGNIRLQVRDEILMRRQSEISASAQGAGNGGNVKIEVPDGFILAFLPENSDIVASARQGNGGVARATAFGVFGFRQFKGFRTPESDFTASSELGIDGRLEIITPNRRLEELPADFQVGEIAQGCEAVRGQKLSRFVITGRGGLPPNPKDVLSSDDLQVPWIPLHGGENSSISGVATKATRTTPLIEAQSWAIDEQGQVVLTATNINRGSWQIPNVCEAH